MFTPNQGHAMQSPEIQTPAKTKPRRVAPATADIHPAALLRISQIIGTPKTPALLNIGRTHFYRLVKEGKFPKPTKLGHMSVWKASDALQAIAKLTEAK
ncbi:MAG TPA: AlpA family phage regulatory protein [Thiomonas arsenitoxydans]|uniref:helix-turn-helix transcriptional regulator n=1 Tax=Thiomonas TaxID=32012 RepID=UPI002580272B|nr:MULTISPECIES: AlpA family phage regulatory protein [Thiomonas]HML80171.1 AlpA family phage regulatory protein [Thiomonas arsenitoxydans]